MRGHLCVALICSFLPLAACSHGPAVRVAPPAPSFAVPSWSGPVRLSSGNGVRTQVDSRGAVASTLQGALASMGVSARVSCLELDGNLVSSGAIHSTVQVEFLSRLTRHDRLNALRLLESLRPGQRAFVEPPVAKPVGVAVVETP